MGKTPTNISYDKQALQYDKEWKAYLENTHNRLLEVFEIQPGDKILDVSAGTGIFGQHIAETTGYEELVLNDISSKMLSVAKDKVGSAPKVKFYNSAVVDLDLPAQHFDRIVSLNAFHYYPDQKKALHKIGELLKPGGYFYLLDWNRSGFFRWVNKVITFLAEEDIHAVSRAEAAELLKTLNFEILHSETWTFQYWKLFLIIGRKKLNQ